MMLSPKGNDLSRGNLTSEIKNLAPDLEMVSRLTINLAFFYCPIFLYTNLQLLMQKREDSIKVGDKVEMLVTEEKVPEEIEDAAKMAAFKDKLDILKHYLEKPNNDIKINNKLEEQDRNKEQPTALSNPKMENIGKFFDFDFNNTGSSVNSDFDIVDCLEVSYVSFLIQIIRVQCLYQQLYQDRQAVSLLLGIRSSFF
jgi:hypothetical protein